MIKCPKCNKKVSELDEKCPFCNVNLEEYDEQIKDERQKEEMRLETDINKEKTEKYVVLRLLISLIMIATTICIFFNIIFSPKDENVNNKTKNDYKMEAYVMSQDFLKDYLKSPTTAKFPTYSAINVIQTNNRYKIEAYVDSQNSFGNMVRTKYYMILERENDGGWIKISCDIK